MSEKPKPIKLGKGYLYISCYNEASVSATPEGAIGELRDLPESVRWRSGTLLWQPDPPKRKVKR